MSRGKAHSETCQRLQFRSSYCPPFEFCKEMEGTNENMGGRDYKSYMTSEQQLEDLLAGLLN